MYMEACKHYMFVDNAQKQSKGHPAWLFTPRATVRPVNDDQGPSAESVRAAVNSISLDALRWMDAFYRFTRPHTVIGTVVGIISISLLAVQSLQDVSLRFAVGLGQAIIPAVCMNVYIVGLNQMYDIDIDKVNKPYLPLASGEFSLNTGISIVTACAFLLPLMRWKQSALAAACCVLSVRAIVVQLAFYMHMQSFVFGRAAVLTKPLIFATGFMCFFSVVIALFKVFWLCIYLLLAAYGVAAIVGFTSEMMWARMAMVLGHGILAGTLWFRATQIDLKSKASITGFYMFVWKVCNLAQEVLYKFPL